MKSWSAHADYLLAILGIVQSRSRVGVGAGGITKHLDIIMLA